MPPQFVLCQPRGIGTPDISATDDEVKALSSTIRLEALRVLASLDVSLPTLKSKNFIECPGLEHLSLYGLEYALEFSTVDSYQSVGASQYASSCSSEYDFIPSRLWALKLSEHTHTHSYISVMVGKKKMYIFREKHSVYSTRQRLPFALT